MSASPTEGHPPNSKRRRSSGRKGAGGGAAAAAGVGVTTRPTGSYMPVSGMTREFPAEGVDASAGVIGTSLPQCMFPGGSHKLRLGSYIGGGVAGTENGRRMSLFLWLIKCAWQAGLTAYAESVIDMDAWEALGEVVQLRLRVFVPVGMDHVQPLLEAMRSTLEGSDDGGGGGGYAELPAVGWECINSVTAFFSAHESVTGASLRRLPTEMTYDTMPAVFDGDDGTAGYLVPSESEQSAGSGDDGSSSDSSDDEGVGAAPRSGSGAGAEVSPLRVLSASALFGERLCEADGAAGADDRQLGEAAYLSSGKLHFPEFSRFSGTGGSLVYHLSPGLNGVVTCPNALLQFNMPLSQPSVAELRDAYMSRLAYSGIPMSPDIECATTVDELEAAVDERIVNGDPLRTARASVLVAAEWPDLLGGDQYAVAHMKIWPMQASVMHRSGMLMRAVVQALGAGRLSKACALRIVRRMITGFKLLTGCSSEGVNPCWVRLEQDRRRLSADIESVTDNRSPSASVARRVFSFLPERNAAGQRMPPLSGMMVQLSEVSLRLNLTLPQISPFLPMWLSGNGLLWNRYGLMTSWVIIGPPDTGKSETAARVIRCVPLSLVRQAHQESSKVTTHNQTIGFKWKDEQDTNIAKGKKGQAASERALMDLSVTALGYGAYSRFKIGDAARGIANDVETVMSEQRCIEISASNEHLTGAKMSRANTCTMYEDAGSVSGRIGVLPTREERTLLPRNSPMIEGQAAALQLMMAYANLSWRAQAFGAQVQSILPLLAVRIFNGLVNAVLVPAGFPVVKCRDLNKMQTHAAAIMQFRVSREFETSERTMVERDAERDLNMLARGVVSFSDVLLAWMQLSSLSDTRHEESRLLATLKANIRIDAGQLDVSLVEFDGNKQYYMTSVRGADGLGLLCPDLGEGIINTIIGKLRYPAEGKAKVIVVDSGEHRGTYGVLKAAVDVPSCVTPTQALMLEFLCEVITTPRSGARHWFPVVTDAGVETGEIAFITAVRDAIMRPHQSGVYTGWFSARGASLDDIKLAFSMFETAKVMCETDENGQSLKKLVHSPIAGPGGVGGRATAGGMLDPSTVLRGHAGYDARVASGHPSTDGERAQWAREHLAVAAPGPLQAPGACPTVAKMSRPGVLVVDTREGMGEMLAAAVEKAKFRAIRAVVPAAVGMAHEDRMDVLLEDFVSSVMAISGEAEPGDWVYTGISTVLSSSSPTAICKGVVLKEFTGSITIKNPRRGHQASTDMVMGPLGDGDADVCAQDDPEDEFLPAGSPTVTFRGGDNLYRKMVEANMRHNTPFLL